MQLPIVYEGLQGEGGFKTGLLRMCVCLIGQGGQQRDRPESRSGAQRFLDGGGVHVVAPLSVCAHNSGRYI